MERTVVVSLSVLFFGSGSRVSDVTLTVSMMSLQVEASTDTVIQNCLVSPAAMVPSVHVTIPPGAAFGSSAQPRVAIKVTPAGSVSVATTFCASDGPLLVTVTL